MVSVGTQTPWSWLETVDSRTAKKGKENESCYEAISDDRKANGRASVCLPEIVAEECTREEGMPAQEPLSLPQIVPGKAGSCFDPDIAGQMERTQLTSDSEDSSSSENDELATAASEALSGPQLSWPAVLRYLRESESEASKYFSLDTGPRELLRRTESDLVRVQENRNLVEDKAAVREAVAERTTQLCHFCGQPRGQWSVLEAVSSGQREQEPCCSQFQDYCLLVAMNLRQMVAERASAQPTEIRVTQQSKSDVKAAAEERALALLRRRKRWEEKQKRKMAKHTLQSSSFYSLTKQTKTIQFSLLSPAVFSTGWTTSGETQRSTQRDNMKKKKKKKKVENKLPQDILDSLKSMVPVPRDVEMRWYPDGEQPAWTLLPDHTGHYFYPSGTVAVLAYSHTPGVLSYLLLSEDGDEVLGYADELGKTWCRHGQPQKSLRLWLSAGGSGAVYSVKGELVRRWDNETEAAGLVVPINKHLTLHWIRRDEVIISFSAGQHHTRITVPHKLKERSEALKREESPDRSSESYLAQAQARIKFLLSSLGALRGQKPPRARSHSIGALPLISPIRRL